MKGKHLALIFFGLFHLTVGLPHLSAYNNLAFRTFSPEGGFYYDGVMDVRQDNEGFIWVLMDENLYRFDGYEYKSYYYHFTSQNKSIRWAFKNMAVDGQGRLLVATSNGLFQYNREEDTFRPILDAKVDLVKVDNKGNIWLYTGRQWSVFDSERQELFTPLCDGDSTVYQRNIFCTYNEDLYILTPYGRVFRYNYSQHAFNLFFESPFKDSFIYDASVFKGKLWTLISRNRLLKTDMATSVVEDQFQLPESSSSKCIHVDQNGFVWIGTIRGLYILNPVTREYTLHVHSETNNFSIPNNSIWTVEEDAQKNIWIGTFSGGLAYVNLEKNAPFHSFFPQKGQLSHAPVSGFAEDDRHIWISTEGGGLNRMNKSTGEFAHFIHAAPGNSLSSNNVKSLVVDKHKRLWISTFGGGMDCLDMEKKQFRNYENIPQNKNSLLSNSLRKIILEADSGLWVAYQDHKLILSYYSFRNDAFTHYTLGGSENQYFIFDVLRDRNHKLWVLSYQKLYLMDLTDHSVQDIAFNDSLYLYGRSLCQDASGNIWIGTTGNGLIRYSPESDTHTVYNQLLDMGVNIIYSISPDDEGHLWLGTDYGLVRFTPQTGQTLRFEKQDGGQGQGYYPLSTMKAVNGDLYFGGTNGFTIITPGQVNRNKHKPKIIISDFLIDNKSTHIRHDKEIVLDYDQSNFGFKFSSDNYLIPEKTRYKYKLSGYDKQWKEVDASNRTAFYSKVPAGVYQFEIVAANNDGIWSEQPTYIKIIRKPAPWFSFPAYILYFLLFLGVAYLVFRYYDRQKKLKLQLYMDELEKNKKEEIHQSQLRFFTNISHDFRTPLTLILGVLNKLKQEGVKEYYYRILQNNAQRLLSLVNELMEFRTIENGKMSLHIEPMAVNRLVESLAADFADYASQRNIRYTLNCDPSLSSSQYIDRQVVEKVVMNLLNNAFKYTKDGGSITVETYVDQDGFKSDYQNSYVINDATGCDSYFVVAIRDTGIGISGESIKSIFERFYKVNTTNAGSHLGTGIGLALVKSLVLLHKGKIAVYSEREKGTDIVVYLPLDPSVYKEEDLLINQSTEEVRNFVADTDEKVLNGKKGEFLRNKKRILIVEDNHDLRELIAGFLSTHYEMVEAENGVEATDILSKMEIDLIVSDIMMPQKDGITLSREVKENLETSHIPIILLTAKTGLENKIEGTEAGADFYFEKPIDFNLLLISINNIFEHQIKLKEYYARNYFVDSPELSANEQDNKFLKRVLEVLDENINRPQLDVNYIASELSMSRSKLYLKIKALTDKSIIEFILNYRLRKAARIIIEEDITMRQIMERIGIESQSYFTNAFKKEFGETPTAFAARNRYK